MSVQQLALDVLAGVRAAGAADVRAAEQHQRGYIRLPHGIYANGYQPAGSIVPAWVCCRCGGVEVNEFVLGINHSCCTVARPPCCVERPGRPGPRDPGPFDAHWMPEQPR